MVSSLDFGVQKARAPIPATPLLLGYVTLVKCPNLRKPQFSHLQNGDDNTGNTKGQL